MVAVQGVTKPALEQYIASFNARQPTSGEHVYLAVINAADHFTVAGEVNSTTSFVAYLRLESADSDKDQSRVPYSKRKSVIYTQYTTISVPYHCSLLDPVIDAIYTVAVEKQWLLDASDMQIAVRAGDDGHDIRTETDLTKYLFTSICVLPVDWPLATQCAGISHIVDFGPGGLSGFGLLACKNVEGLGVPIICAGALVSRSSKPYMGAKADLYKTDFADISVAPNWQT
ncbi:fatty acid synthase alpha subunit Lsd1, partial [Coemansia thaxteri]